MVEFSLVRLRKTAYDALVAAWKFDSSAAISWHWQHFNSLDEAAQTPARNYCTIVLFNFTGANDHLKSEIVAFQLAAAGTPLAAVLSNRKFDSEEISFLNSLNVRTCIDTDALADPARLHRILCHLTEQLTPSILLQMLRPHLSEAALVPIRRCVRMLATNPAAFASATTKTAVLREIRRQSNARIAHPEHLCILVQNLYAAVLMKLTLQPLGRVSGAAGFPTANAARQSLNRKTGLTARQAHDEPAKLNEVIHLLIQLIKEATESCDSPKRDNRTTGQQDNRTTGQQDNRTTGQQSVTDFSAHTMVAASPTCCAAGWSRSNAPRPTPHNTLP